MDIFLDLMQGISKFVACWVWSATFCWMFREKDMLSQKLARRLAVVGLALMVGVSTARAELVVNGGFETGDFSGWTTQSAPSGSFFNVISGAGANGSNNFAQFGALGSGDYISQMLSTTIGEEYIVSFYIRNTSSYINERFNASWEGSDFFYEDPVGIRFGWTKITANLTSTQLTSELRLGGFDGQDVVYLDEVSVIPVPEPTSLSVLALGATAALRRRRVS